jgi:hypothetical protein
MVAYSLGKTNWNPLNVALANGSKGCFAGSSSSDFFSFLSSQGFTVYSGPGQNLASGAYFNYTLAKKRLAAGCWLITASDMTFESSGKVVHGGPHQTVITSIDSNDVITIQDPTFCTSDTNHTPRLVKNRVDVSSGALVIRSWLTSYAVCP